MCTLKPTSHAVSFFFGAVGSHLLMVLTPIGSTDPTSFGFYWALFLGMFSSFSTASIVRRLQKKAKEIAYRKGPFVLRNILFVPVSADD